MSTNLHLKATVPTTLHLTNGENIYSETSNKFSLWQTPTLITESLIRAKCTLDAYKDWVLSVSEEKTEDIYDFAADLLDPPIVGTRVIHPGKMHIKELEEWLNTHENWNINWISM